MPVDPRLKGQVELIQGALSDVEVHPPDWADTGDFEYLYRANRVLARSEHAPRVSAALSAVLAGEGSGGSVDDDSADTAAHGLHRLRWRHETLTPRQVFDRLDRELGAGVARPDHVLYVAGYACPAGEPLPPPPGTTRPSPETPRPAIGPAPGSGVRVHIVDNGLLASAPSRHDWLAGVTGEPDETVDPDTGLIAPYAGHGTFVAGTLRTQAPAAAVHVDRALLGAGAAYESDVVARLAVALDAHPDVVVLSFVASTRGDLSLVSLDALYEQRIRYLTGIVFVTPAGNDNSRAAHWPAAYPWVISVGALARDGRTRAPFSNHGGWVDVFAPGESLVNAFAVGEYAYTEPPFTAGARCEFDGLATWSGTSFAAPLVGGMIAARMSASGENAAHAARAVLAGARAHAVPGVGAVLLPGQD